MKLSTSSRSLGFLSHSSASGSLTSTYAPLQSNSAVPSAAGDASHSHTRVAQTLLRDHSPDDSAIWEFGSVHLAKRHRPSSHTHSGPLLTSKVGSVHATTWMTK
jgi:hypothetical protein